MERSFKSDNDSSTIEDYVYKLPPPIIKSEAGIEDKKMPQNLPKDLVTEIDKLVSNV